ncbi:poly(U)-specific endoribonuclease-B [Cucurbita pepo subsp. pepo]|uniref:poly(U)-specific endoribonuclease-B n=1 Tax=Cucurbita pepo subsp. pepo TaxID=3664 RepID=UPI000C9D66C2|nr:poly(U)-specific endoribonuclease-B [Cucurbita pepo subsp. pepo]
MEGLIKGLIDVAIGHDDDNNNNNEQSAPQSRDERSRSTWAQVVTGEEDADRDGGDRGHDRRHGNDSNRRDNEKEGRSRREEEWEVEGSRISGQRQQGEYGSEHGYNRDQWAKKEGSEENNDGWETVHKKAPRKHHKVQVENWEGYKRPASEQNYSDEVEVGAELEPSEDELADFARACNKLWELDLNRLVPGQDYEIDCGEGKRVHGREDMAQASLFSWVNEDVFRKPTFSRFCSLLDNYNPDQGSKEVVTPEERQEQAAFIEEISRTAPIKYLHKYLSYKGVTSNDYQDFKRMLTSLWFDLYGRGGTSHSSSAFEHVFVGEIKQQGGQEVSGFHNWLQFYLEEAKGSVDYQGYIFPRRRGQFPDSETQLLTIQFEWNGVLKSVSSTLVGVSPEFELALYTLCFFLGGEDNHVELGPYPVNIKCYRLGNKIGSVFPVAES